MLAIADESDESHVSHGENGGRALKHVAVVRSLTQVGTLDLSGKFSKDLQVSFDHEHAGNLRVVVIVQEPEAGRVRGVGEARVSN